MVEQEVLSSMRMELFWDILEMQDGVERKTYT